MTYHALDISPAEMKALLTSTAMDMSTPGHDYESGFGFIQVDSAMLTFAAPIPQTPPSSLKPRNVP